MEDDWDETGNWRRDRDQINHILSKCQAGLKRHTATRSFFSGY